MTRDQLLPAAADYLRMSEHATSTRRLCALVAEDEPDIRELVALSLEHDGWTVLRAADGFDALELALVARPDVAVLDVAMPRVNGLELAAQLRASSATHDIPIVFLSARTTDLDVARGLGAGGDDYVRKPFSPTELKRRIADVLAA
jgi:DNA-binding response OmpR family regulator